jgi:hypothetical protein
MLVEKSTISDVDAAIAYGVSLATLRRAVWKNRSRFSHGAFEDRAEIVLGQRFRFSEQGFLQLSTVLNSPQAIRMNIEVIRELVGFRTN